MSTELYFELSDGGVVTLRASNTLTAETFSELQSYLAVYERSLAKRAAVAARTPEPRPNRTEPT